MPHLVIEYTQGLEKRYSIDDIMTKSYQAAIKAELFEPQRIKVRAIPYQHSRIALEKKDFIHTTVSILSGRTAEQKQKLSNLIGVAQRRCVGEINSLTVEVRDMEKASYYKS